MKKRIFGKHLDFYEAIATLVGTTIGAGIMGIPYVVMKAGIIAGLIDLLVLSFVVLMINLYVGEVCLRTKKTHQLAGFAEHYLGKKGKFTMAIISLLGIVGALVAYIIGMGQVTEVIFGGNAFTNSLIFFVVGATLIYFDLKAIEKAELYLNVFVVLILFIIIGVCFFNFDSLNIVSKEINVANLFVPYGVILFAMVGASAIPAMEKEMEFEKEKMKKAIIIGTFIPFIVYILFMIAVMGVTGLLTTEIATIGLGEKIGQSMILLGNLLPFFTMSTSFFILGLALKWMFHYDFKIKNFWAWILTCSIPLALFLAGANSFIGVIGITGAVAGGLEGIMIMLIAKKSKEHGDEEPLYNIGLSWIFVGAVIMLFVLGIISQFVKL